MQTADPAVLFPAVVTGVTDAASGHLKESSTQSSDIHFIVEYFLTKTSNRLRK